MRQFFGISQAVQGYIWLNDSWIDVGIERICRGPGHSGAVRRAQFVAYIQALSPNSAALQGLGRLARQSRSVDAMAANRDDHLFVVALFLAPPVANAAIHQVTATHQIAAGMRNLASGQAGAGKVAHCRRIARAIEKAGLTRQPAVGDTALLAPIGDAAFFQPLVEDRNPAPDAIASYCAVTQRRATTVTASGCIGAAKALAWRNEALVKADGAEGERFHGWRLDL